MANIPISSLPAAASVDGTELVPIVQGGTTKRVTVAQISTFPAVSGSFVTATDMSASLPTSRLLAAESGVTTVTDGGPSSTIIVGIATNGISNAKFRQSAALSVVGNATNALANVADIAAASDHQILRRSGSAIGFGSVDLSQSAAVGSSVLGFLNGGTGQSSYALGDTLYASATNVLAKLPGNITTTRQFLSQTGTGAISAAPAWATIAGTDVTGAALTSVNDTNVTLALGGTPATALLRAASITAGWTGQLSLARGGTNANLTASNGGLVYSTASALAIFAGTATAGQIPRSGASAAPSWSTATYPATAAAGTILAAGTLNTIAGTSTPTLGVAGSLLGTLSLAGNTSGAVTIQPQAAAGTYNFNLPTSAGTAGQPLLSGGGGAAAMTFGTLGVAGGGTGAATFTLNGVLYGNGTSALQVTAQGAANSVLTANAGAPSFSNSPTVVSLTATTTLNAAAATTTLGAVSGTIDMGGATSLEIPNSAAPTVNANGEIAVDTTVTDFAQGIIKYFSTAEMGVVAMPVAQFGSPINGAVPTYNSSTDQFDLATPAGGGTVTFSGTAPADNAMTRFDGISGTVIQRTQVIIDDSDNVSGVNSIAGNVIATQAQQEAGTSVINVVTPGTQQFHASAAKGWVFAGVTGTAVVSYNLTSVTDNGTGNITVNWDTDFSTANHAPIASLLDSVNTTTFRVNGIAAGTVNVLSYNLTGTLTDPSGYFVADFGDQ
jgi:hypothetical protein